MSLVFIMPPLFIVFVFTTGVQANRTASLLPRTPARLGHYIRIKPCKLRLSLVGTHSWQMCLFRTLHNRYCSSVKDITGETCVFSGHQLGPSQAWGRGRIDCTLLSNNVPCIRLGDPTGPDSMMLGLTASVLNCQNFLHKCIFYKLAAYLFEEMPIIPSIVWACEFLGNL